MKNCRIIDIDQRSLDWHEMRKGRVTASNFKKFVTPAKFDLVKDPMPYVYELLESVYAPEERPDLSNNVHVQRGIESEPLALELFAEMHPYFDVKQVGFVAYNEGYIGLSPDALLYRGGEPVAGLEIKCPQYTTHCRYHWENKVPSEYRAQVYGSMALTGLPWYFMSYHHSAKPFIKVIDTGDETEKILQTIEQFTGLYLKTRQQLEQMLGHGE